MEQEGGTLVEWFSSLSLTNKVILVSSGLVAIGGAASIYLWGRYLADQVEWEYKPLLPHEAGYIPLIHPDTLARRRKANPEFTKGFARQQLRKVDRLKDPQLYFSLTFDLLGLHFLGGDMKKASKCVEEQLEFIRHLKSIGHGCPGALASDELACLQNLFHVVGTAQDIPALVDLNEELLTLEKAALKRLSAKFPERKGKSESIEEHEERRQRLMAEGFPRCLAHSFTVLQTMLHQGSEKTVQEFQAIERYHAYTLPLNPKMFSVDELLMQRLFFHTKGKLYLHTDQEKSRQAFHQAFLAEVTLPFWHPYQELFVPLVNEFISTKQYQVAFQIFELQAEYCLGGATADLPPADDAYWVQACMGLLEMGVVLASCMPWATEEHYQRVIRWFQEFECLNATADTSPLRAELESIYASRKE